MKAWALVIPLLCACALSRAPQNQGDFCHNPERAAFTRMEDALTGTWKERESPYLFGSSSYKFGVWGKDLSLFALNPAGVPVEPVVFKAELKERKFLGTFSDGRPIEGQVYPDNATVAFAVRQSTGAHEPMVFYMQCVGP